MIVFRFATAGIKIKSLKDLKNRAITPLLRLAKRSEIERWEQVDNAPNVSLRKTWGQNASWGRWS